MRTPARVYKRVFVLISTVITVASGIRGCYARMLIARAITSAPMTTDTAASVIIMSLAHGLIAEVSVGLNAVAVQKPSDR